MEGNSHSRQLQPSGRPPWHSPNVTKMRRAQQPFLSSHKDSRKFSHSQSSSSSPSAAAAQIRSERVTRLLQYFASKEAEYGSPMAAAYASVTRNRQYPRREEEEEAYPYSYGRQRSTSKPQEHNFPRERYRHSASVSPPPASYRASPPRQNTEFNGSSRWDLKRESGEERPNPYAERLESASRPRSPVGGTSRSRISAEYDEKTGRRKRHESSSPSPRKREQQRMIKDLSDKVRELESRLTQLTVTSDEDEEPGDNAKSIHEQYREQIEELNSKIQEYEHARKEDHLAVMRLEKEVTSLKQELSTAQLKKEDEEARNEAVLRLITRRVQSFHAQFPESVRRSAASDRKSADETTEKTLDGALQQELNALDANLSTVLVEREQFQKDYEEAKTNMEAMQRQQREKESNDIGNDFKDARISELSSQVKRLEEQLSHHRGDTNAFKKKMKAKIHNKQEKTAALDKQLTDLRDFYETFSKTITESLSELMKMVNKIPTQPEVCETAPIAQAPIHSRPTSVVSELPRQEVGETCSAIFKSLQLDMDSLANAMMSTFDPHLEKLEKTESLLTHCRSKQKILAKAVTCHRERATQQIVDKNYRIESLEKQIAALEDQLNSASSQLNTDESSFAQLKNEKRSIERQLSDVEERLDASDAQLAATKDKLSTVQKEKDHTEERLHNLQADLAAKKNEKHSLERQLSALQSKLENSETQLAKIREELSLEKEEKAHTDERLQSVQAGLTASENEKQQLEEKLSGLRTELESSKTDLEDAKEELAAVQSEKTQAEERLQNVQDELSRRENELRSKKEEIDSMSDEMDQLRKSRSSLEENVKTFELSIQRHRNDSEKEEQRLKEKIDEKAVQINVLQTKLEDKESAYKEEIQEINSTLSTNTQKLQALESEKKELEDELARFRNYIDQVNQSKASFKAKVQRRSQSQKKSARTVRDKVHPIKQSVGQFKNQFVSWQQESTEQFQLMQNYIQRFERKLFNALDTSAKDEATASLQNSLESIRDALFGDNKGLLQKLQDTVTETGEKEVHSLENLRSHFDSNTSESGKLSSAVVKLCEEIDNVFNQYKKSVREAWVVRGDKEKLQNQLSSLRADMDRLDEKETKEDEGTSFSKEAPTPLQFVEQRWTEEPNFTTSSEDMSQIEEVRRRMLSYPERLKAMNDEYKQLNETLADSEKTVKRYHDENYQLRQSMQEMEDQIRQLSNEKENADSRLENEIKEKNTLQKKLDISKSALTNQKELLNSRIQELQTAVESRDATISRLQHNLEESTKSENDQLENLKNERDEWQKKHEEEKSTLVSKINSLQSENELNDSEIADLKTQLEDLELKEKESRKALENEVIELKDKIDESKKEIEQKKSEICRLEKKLEDSNGDQNEQLQQLREEKGHAEKTLEQESQKLRKEIQTLRNDVDEKESKINQLESNNSESHQSQKEQVKTFEDEKASLSSRVYELEEILKKRDEQLEDMKQEKEEIQKNQQGKKTVLNAEVDKLRREIDAKVSEVNRLEQALEDSTRAESEKLEQLRQERDEVHEKLQQQETNLKSSIDELKGQLDSKECEVHNLESNVAQLEESERNYKVLLERLKEEKEEMREEKNELNTKISELEDQVELKRSHIHELEKDIGQLKESEQTRNAQFKQLKEENENTLQVERNELNAKVHELERQVDSKELQIHQLENDIDQLKESEKVHQEQSDGMQELRAHFESKLITVKSSLLALQGEVRNVGGEAEDLIYEHRADKMHLQKYVQKVQSQIQQDLGILMDAFRNYDQALTHLKEEKETLSISACELERVTEELNATKISLSSLQQELKDSSDEVKAKDRNIVELENRIEKMQNNETEIKKEAFSENDTLQRANSSLERKVEDLKGRLNRIQSVKVTIQQKLQKSCNPMKQDLISLWQETQKFREAMDNDITRAQTLIQKLQMTENESDSEETEKLRRMCTQYYNDYISVKAQLQQVEEDTAVREEQYNKVHQQLEKKDSDIGQYEVVITNFARQLEHFVDSMATNMKEKEEKISKSVSQLHMMDNSLHSIKRLCRPRATLSPTTTVRTDSPDRSQGLLRGFGTPSSTSRDKASFAPSSPRGTGRGSTLMSYAEAPPGSESDVIQKGEEPSLKQEQERKQASADKEDSFGGRMKENMAEEHGKAVGEDSAEGFGQAVPREEAGEIEEEGEEVEEIPQDVLDFLLHLLNGFRFMKFGSWAIQKPHERVIWLDVTGSYLFLQWSKPGQEGQDESRTVTFDEILEITKGRQSKILKKKGKPEHEDKYLSISTENRVLDMEFPDKAMRDWFHDNMEKLIHTPGLLQDGLVELVNTGQYEP